MEEKEISREAERLADELVEAFSALYDSCSIMPIIIRKIIEAYRHKKRRKLTYKTIRPYCAKRNSSK